MTPRILAPRRSRLVEALEPRLLLSSYLVTNVDDSGAGSLRADIVMSNASPGANTITFAPGLSGTIALTTGQLEIASNLTIVGPGASTLTISGNMQSRVFQVDEGVTVSISGLTVTAGRAPDGAAGSPASEVNGRFVDGTPGGAGGEGGGIYSLGTLTLSGDAISGNSAGLGGAGGAGETIPDPTRPTYVPGGMGGPGGKGGAIYSSGALSIMNSTLDSNRAGNGGPGAAGDPSHPIGNEGGVGGEGGGIYTTGPLTITGSTIHANHAGGGGASGFSALGPDGGSGGGVFATGPLTISDSMIDANIAGYGGSVSSDSGLIEGGIGGGGGGIDAAGTTVLTGSTVSGNITGNGGPGSSRTKTGAAGSGGGIIASGSLTAANCTISNNVFGASNPFIADPPAQGGGIDSTGLLHLTNCTVSGNGAGLYAAGDAVLDNTVIAANPPSSAQGYDVFGTLDPSGAYNLVGDGWGMTGLTAANHNQIGKHQNPIDPKLGPLANNGGPTQTMALLAGSPAIDAGSNALAVDPDGSRLLTDQRGYGRIFNGIVDIGAYEYGSSIPGDANGDGTVDFTDLLVVGRHYGQTGATWTQGDFDGDGSVGFDDLVILARNYGQTTSASQAASVFAAADVGAAASVSAAAEQQPAAAPRWLSVSRRQAYRRAA